MKIFSLLLLVAVCTAVHAQTTPSAVLRPPAVPLVVHDPLFSIWSEGDNLAGDTTRHWTGRPHPLTSLVRVDGKSFRLMGSVPTTVPALPQLGVRVLPTRTLYEFGNSQIHLSLTFTTPALSDDFEVCARPVTYLTWTIKAVDKKSHQVALYFGAGAQIAVNTPDQEVEATRQSIGNLTALRTGTTEQSLLQPAGDGTRIDWGYFYAAAPSREARTAIGASPDLLTSFVTKGALPVEDDKPLPRPASDHEPTLGFIFDIGSVGETDTKRHLLLAYDEIYAIQFLGQNLRPYWRRNGATASDLLTLAEHDYAQLQRRCQIFDTTLMRDLEQQGGQRYALIAALAYRQALAGCGWAADSNKQPLLFTKENTSNGCIATTDVLYPAAPQFLLMGSSFAKALVAPILVYSTSPRWKFPFAPHDIGIYPQANGQVYGGGETSTNEGDMMPVEESANIILLCDAIAKMDGNAAFAANWWQQLTRWESYLEKYGLDPENQLCTDDFMGHLAHNTNLSVKAILAIAAYGDLCKMRGDTVAAEKYLTLARADAKHWMMVAADGAHYRIAFDKPDTWSQKYNLVWDKLLHLNVFPAEVAQKEVAYYKTSMLKYGVPLDSRTHLTKTDWSVWSATLAESGMDFEAIISPIYDYLNDTTARMPFVDSYITDNAASDGMHARPVIGGVFIKMLADPTMWKKWAQQDQTKARDWAAAPRPPRITEVVPTSQHQSTEWHYTFSQPPLDWNESGFVESGWKTGTGGFGTEGTPGAVVGTTWNTGDIWLRRQVAIPLRVRAKDLQLFVYHDEDVDIYINGVLAAKQSGYGTNYGTIPIRPAALALLKPGAKVVLAVHCHQTTGGQGVDVGIVQITPDNNP